MIHVEDAVVLLNCEEEIAASYLHHRPIAGQFTVARPYQEAGPKLDSTTACDDEGICEDREGHGPKPLAHSAAAPEIPAAAAENVPHSLPHNPDAAWSQQKECTTYEEQPTQRRKRKQKQHVYQPNAQVATIAPATCRAPCVTLQMHNS